MSMDGCVFFFRGNWPVNFLKKHVAYDACMASKLSSQTKYWAEQGQHKRIITWN